MAYIILPSRRKWPNLFELDHSHPLASGLVFFPHAYRYNGRVVNLVNHDPSDICNGKWNNNALVGTDGPYQCVWNESIVLSGAGDFTFCVRTNQGSKYNFTPIIGQANFTFNFTGIKFNSAHNSTSQSARMVALSVNSQEGVTINAFLPSVAAPYYSNVFHHYVGMRKNGIYSLYIDGVQVTPSSANHGFAPISTTLDLVPAGYALGCIPYSSHLSNFLLSNGAAITDGLIYNRALSEDEIALLADRTDPMLGGLIRESKNRTYHAFNSKFDIAGVQSGNNLNFTWGK